MKEGAEDTTMKKEIEQDDSNVIDAEVESKDKDKA
jgi:hypothetical protein